MYENLQFIQSFRNKSIGPLMNELLDDTIEPIDIKDVHFDDHTSVSSDDTPMRHSQSAESLSSMASHGSHASFDQWQQQNNFLEFYAAGRYAQAIHLTKTMVFYSRRVSMSVHDLQSQDRLMSQQSGSDGRDSKFQLCSNDSDPDYNITLTADSFRNVQTMEVDSREQQPPEFQQQQGVQECRPQFFIDSAGGGGIFQGGQQQQQQFNPQMQNHPPTSTTITGHGHHVFTVEKTDANALPMNSHQCRQMLVNGGQQTMVSAERQQPTIIQKSQSYPFTAEQADSITSIPTSASSDRFH